jgi:hypothetical protein
VPAPDGGDPGSPGHRILTPAPRRGG